MRYFLSGMKRLGVPALLSAPSIGFAQWERPDGWGVGPGMMGWGILAWLNPIMMLIFWVAIILGIIFFIRWHAVSRRGSRNSKLEDSALDILKKRYARGEIHKEEFEEKKKDLI
jgi:putative membrane protein